MQLIGIAISKNGGGGLRKPNARLLWFQFQEFWNLNDVFSIKRYKKISQELRPSDAKIGFTTQIYVIH